MTPAARSTSWRRVRDGVGADRVETTRAKLNAYDAYIDHPLDIRGDKIYLSDRPGLGIELYKDHRRGHVIEGYSG